MLSWVIWYVLDHDFDKDKYRIIGYLLKQVGYFNYYTFIIPMNIWKYHEF